jgi:hypothetical protein
LPAPPSDVELLALLTRGRAAAIARGEYDRLYDLRPFKACMALVGHLHLLAAGDAARGRGGSVVTSLRQLVAAARAWHPAWNVAGDTWAVRDRHQATVRGHLGLLEEAGLVKREKLVDEDLEERGTVLVLLGVPEIGVDELAAAAVRLELWVGRYQSVELNTGARMEIPNARSLAAPLSASERQRRGCVRARARAANRRWAAGERAEGRPVAPLAAGNVDVLRGSSQFKDPPSGALPEGENYFAEALTSNAHEIRNVCGLTARVTCANSSADFTVSATISVAETAASRRSTPEGRAGSGVADDLALLERVRARGEALEPVLVLKVAQMRQRAGEVALWAADRSLPVGRVREAWVVWCLGERDAANCGACLAGALDDDDPGRLGRAARRYERHVGARPEGWPELGLGALAQIASEDAERRSEPSLHRSIRALDQLSRRMRAIDTMRDGERRDRQAERAAGRHAAAAVEPVGRFTFRSSPARVWPWWVQLDPGGQAILIDGELVIVEDRIRVAPPRGDRVHVETLRDARLLAGLWAQQDGDGRYAMAARNQPRGECSALPGPYPAPAPTPRRERVDPRLLELARLTGLKLWQVTQMHSGRGHRDEDLDDALKRARAKQGQR